MKCAASTEGGGGARPAVIGRIGLALLLVATLPPAIARAGDRLVCPLNGWEITGGLDDERQIACDGIDRALGLLQECGLPSRGGLRVRLHDRLPTHCGVPVHGLFDARDNEISLGRPSVCAEQAPEGSLYQLIPAPMAFLSVAGHEATHALLFAGGLDTGRTQEHEYIAGVVQFALIPDDTRTAVLARLDLPDSVGIWQFNALAYAMDPLRYAGLAWRHFAAEPDGCALLRAMAEGTLRLPDFSAF